MPCPCTLGRMWTSLDPPAQSVHILHANPNLTLTPLVIAAGDAPPVQASRLPPARCTAGQPGAASSPTASLRESTPTPRPRPLPPSWTSPSLCCAPTATATATATATTLSLSSCHCYCAPSRIRELQPNLCQCLRRPEATPASPGLAVPPASCSLSLSHSPSSAILAVSPRCASLSHARVLSLAAPLAPLTRRRPLLYAGRRLPSPRPPFSSSPAPIPPGPQRCRMAKVSRPASPAAAVQEREAYAALTPGPAAAESWHASLASPMDGAVGARGLC
ncbi:hypothetical protein PSV09DRAFT_1193618 [Bipolaris maydis]|nr:hypothetical protein PSV09DRAFT_1193618 [Bipolaris maydis]